MSSRLRARARSLISSACRSKPADGFASCSAISTWTYASYTCWFEAIIAARTRGLSARPRIDSTCGDGLGGLAVGGVELAALGGHGGLNGEDRCSGERVRVALGHFRRLRERLAGLVETSQLQQRFRQAASRQRLAGCERGIGGLGGSLPEQIARAFQICHAGRACGAPHHVQVAERPQHVRLIAAPAPRRPDGEALLEHRHRGVVVAQPYPGRADEQPGLCLRVGVGIECRPARVRLDRRVVLAQREVRRADGEKRVALTALVARLPGERERLIGLVEGRAELAEPAGVAAQLLQDVGRRAQPARGLVQREAPPERLPRLVRVPENVEALRQPRQRFGFPVFIAHRVAQRDLLPPVLDLRREVVEVMVVGFANDGIAGVPGVLRVTVRDDEGRVLVGGGLDPGWPVPGKIRQARLPLPSGTAWTGLRLGAELEIKGTRHPVRWACHQKLEPDGSLRLRRTQGIG